MYRPIIKPLSIAVAYACHVIGNEWRDRHGLPRNP